MDSKEASWMVAVVEELNGLLNRVGNAAQALDSICVANPAAAARLQSISADLERAREVVDLVKATCEAASTPAAAARMPSAPEEVPEFSPSAEGFAGGIANPCGQKELILIVDDENFVTLLAERVLVEEDYRVLTAHDGFEALKIYEELHQQIAMVVLDFTMPVMDGAEVFDEMRRINPKVVVMVSSGFTEQERLKVMLANGLKGFLPKPYTKQKLVSQIRSTLDALQR